MWLMRHKQSAESAFDDRNKGDDMECRTYSVEDVAKILGISTKRR